MRRVRWTLARWVYRTPLRPMWPWVAPRITAGEPAEIHKRGDESGEWARRHFS